MIFFLERIFMLIMWKFFCLAYLWWSPVVRHLNLLDSYQNKMTNKNLVHVQSKAVLRSSLPFLCQPPPLRSLAISYIVINFLLINCAWRIFLKCLTKHGLPSWDSSSLEKSCICGSDRNTCKILNNSMTP